LEERKGKRGEKEGKERRGGSSKGIEDNILTQWQQT